MKRSEVFINISLVVVDILMILAGFTVAYYARLYASDFVPVMWVLPFDEYIQYLALFIPVWLGVFAAMGLYTFRGVGNLAREIFKTLFSVSAVLSLMIIIIFFNRDQFFSRLIIIYAWVAISALVILGRLLLRWLQRFLYRYGVGVRRLLIVGSNGKSLDIINFINERSYLGWEIAGVLDEKKQKGEKVGDYRVLGGIDRLSKIHKRYYLDEIWLAGDVKDDYMISLIGFCHERDLLFRFVPSVLEMVSANVDTQSIAGIPIIALRETALEGWGRIFKRFLDIVFSLLVFIFLWPIFLIIAVAIKLDTPGPVMYPHTRVGRKGKLFTIYKFRSMRAELSVGEGFGGKEAEKLRKELEKKANEAEGPMFKIKEDPRITRVGKFIRKTRLDELPQFWNVLIGDMSVIGPRPPLPTEVEKYEKHQLKRLVTKGGITGPWQVTGRHDLDFDDIVKLETYYIENWSLGLDMQIFFKTIWLMLTKRGQ